MSKINKKPKIRFKGFTDFWEQFELGEIGETFTGLSGKSKDDFGHGDANFVTYMNVFLNPLANPSLIEPIEIDNKQNEVQAGDVFFTTSSETPEEVGMSSVWIENRPNTYLNSFCFGYRPIEKFDNYYLAYMLRSTSFRKKIAFLAQGISRYNISKNKVMEITVPKPDIGEQNKIGVFFKQLDDLIILHQHKYEELLKIKKALLGKMFPNKGENVPQIRFKEFTDNWEQRKLGEVGETFTGLSGKSKADFGHGDANFVTYMNVFSNAVANPSLTEPIEVDAKQNKVQAGDVFFTTSSETPKEVGMSSVWIEDRPNTYLNSFCFGYRPIEKFDNYYLAYMLRSTAVRKKITFLAQGISRYNISKNKVMEIAVPKPDIREQTKIGLIFKQLDNLITLYQRELEKLKNIKDACLDKMFI